MQILEENKKYYFTFASLDSLIHKYNVFCNSKK